jgi:copper chaperone NosL
METGEKTVIMKRVIIVSGLVLFLSSCSTTYEPIDYGKDACAHCRMTIVDDRYAAEAVTAKGRAYKFDDVVCMKQFIAARSTAGQTLVFVEDYLKQQDGAIDATSAVYLQHDFFSSPMNGNYAAFATEADARQLSDSLKVSLVKWEEL